MLWETIFLAMHAIRRNMLRSSLTVLGIVIGVAAVITLVTMGNGATAQITSEISSLGSNMLFVRPGQGGHNPGGAHAPSPMFKAADADAIRREISGLAAVAPTASTVSQAIYGNENWSTSVIGSTDSYLTIREWKIKTGRQFTPGEEQAGKAVCILGATVKKELFGAQDPLGASIRLKKLSCQVIGTLRSKGQSTFGSDQDDFVLVPLRLLQRRLSGNNDVSGIFISARNGVNTKKIKEDIARLMRQRRHIGHGQDDDFRVRDMKEIMGAVTSTTRVLTALLGAVAAVSLLVGGIGIMNIMLVSVTERTREIGIRLAIGALEKEVMLQFLVEAVVLSCFGGLIGIALGLTAAAVGVHFLKMPFIFDLRVILLAFLFSGGVGVIFGYFPARKAARLDPIEALRHE
ncbi:MAG TPA: FtsX-like permease family protein [Desulfobacterales bacterium]|nr:FtsX-like permease family protein [Desulfobacterales bacterium]